jgi:NDP-sugar pyrophosphorylase family protein
MIPAMILSAGLGTRMRPVSEWRAKPLAPVGDRPAIAHILGALRGAGIRRIVTNAHHRAEDVQSFARADGELEVTEERDLLGTAGGVAFAREKLGEGDVLVWNGDILGAPRITDLCAMHRAEATLVVVPGPKGHGNVGLAKDGRVVRLRNETTAPGEVQGGEFAGIHVLGAELRRALPEIGCLVGDVYLPALRSGARIDAMGISGFVDIGTIEGYLAANFQWLEMNGKVSGGHAYVAPGADVSPRVTLHNAIVHPHAIVRGTGRVTRVVVWEDAVCEAPVADAVVAPQGVAHVPS